MAELGAEDEVHVGLILRAQDEPFPLSSLQGTWEGSGRFLDIKWAKEIGFLPIQINFAADGTVTGSVGDATLIETELRNWKDDGFEVRALIDGNIKEGKIYRKNHFIIFGHIQQNEMELNYHLKSNFIFDFTMHVCGVRLKRVQ